MGRRLALALAALAGCGESPPPEVTPPFSRLSLGGLFAGALAEQRPAANVVAYDVISQLYADQSGKLRFLALPAGGKIQFDPSGPWRFPEGTMIVKSFYYDRDARRPDLGRTLLETRLLWRHDGEWSAFTYLWDEAQTDAVALSAGRPLTVQRTGASGLAETIDYQVPSTAQCKTCHGQYKRNEPLGPRTRQLNFTFDDGQGPKNQLQRLADRGLLDRPLPAPATLDRLEDFRSAKLPAEARARSYLDGNCAHCHNPGGLAASTNLQLHRETTSPVDLGVCRRPVAAGPAAGGLDFDVVPGQPERSILVHRMKSSDPKTKMPPLPLSTVDVLGVEVVSAWIKGLTGSCP